MKRFIANFFLLIAVLFTMPSLMADAINKNKIVGTWQINAEIIGDVPHKNWTGTITVTRRGNKLSGVLNWSNAETGWQVKEDMTISVKGQTITMQGVAVEVLSKPENDIEYYLDSFQFTMDGTSEQTVPVTAADSQGIVATFTISKTE